MAYQQGSRPSWQREMTEQEYMAFKYAKPLLLMYRYIPVFYLHYILWYLKYFVLRTLRKILWKDRPRENTKWALKPHGAADGNFKGERVVQVDMIKSTIKFWICRVICFCHIYIWPESCYLWISAATPNASFLKQPYHCSPESLVVCGLLLLSSNVFVFNSAASVHRADEIWLKPAVSSSPFSSCYVEWLFCWAELLPIGASAIGPSHLSA